jgi:hypothetical protein
MEKLVRLNKYTQKTACIHSPVAKTVQSDPMTPSAKGGN